jgi:hypothetical protein
MGNDTPDWQRQVQTFRQALYPTGSSGLAPPTPSFSTTAGGTAAPSFAIPPGTIAVRIMASANGLIFTYQLNVTGHQTVEQYFGDLNAPGAPLQVPEPTAPFDLKISTEWDTQIDLSVIGDPTRAVHFFVSAIFTAEPPGQIQAAQAVSMVQQPQWSTFNHVDSAGTATCASPTPSPGRKAVLDVVTFSGIFAAARRFTGRVWDGNSGVLQIGCLEIGTGPAAAAPSVSGELHRLQSSAGNKLTFDFDFAIGANEAQAITASGWFEA